jgi:hypothetical protein
MASGPSAWMRLEDSPAAAEYTYKTIPGARVYRRRARVTSIPHTEGGVIICHVYSYAC